MRITVSSILLLLTLELSAQFDPVFDQYWQNLGHYNPAFMPEGQSLYANAQIRVNRFNKELRWPPYNRSFLVNGFSKKLNSGIGANYLVDQFGSIDEQKFMVNYFYQVQIDETQYLNVGTSGGFYTIDTDISWIPKDPASDGVSHRREKFIMNAGALYSLKDFKVGASFTNLFSPTVVNRFNLFGSYDYRFSESWSLTGRLFGVADGKTAYVNATVLGNYKNIILGTGHWLQDAFVFYGGYDLLEKFQVLYSINVTPSPISAASGPTSELSVRFKL